MQVLGESCTLAPRYSFHTLTPLAFEDDAALWAFDFDTNLLAFLAQRHLCESLVVHPHDWHQDRFARRFAMVPIQARVLPSDRGPRSCLCGRFAATPILGRGLSAELRSHDSLRVGNCGRVHLRSIVLTGAISGMWWGIWGLVVSMFLGFRPFWRRGSKHSSVPRKLRAR